MAAPGGAYAQGADSKFQVVENWAHFPPGDEKWGGATGVDVDSKGNVYVAENRGKRVHKFRIATDRVE